MKATTWIAALFAMGSFGCAAEVEFSGTPSPSPALSQATPSPERTSADSVEATPPDEELEDEYLEEEILEVVEPPAAPPELVASRKTWSLRQINRPIETLKLKQGSAGVLVRQELTLTPGTLDLLVVVDNSVSMLEEQRNLAERVEGLLGYVGDSDWRIAIVTTDADSGNPLGSMRTNTGRGCLRDLVKRGDTNLKARFSAAIRAGNQGSPNEQGFRMAVEGLGCRPGGESWLRADSHVSVLFLTDEDNCWVDLSRACQGQPWADENYLLNFLKQDLGRELGVSAKIYGIYWQPNTACTTAYKPGEQYARAIAATSGEQGSICASDYSATLERIARDIASSVPETIDLETLPDGAITIYFDQNLFDGVFTVEGQKLVFTGRANARVVTLEYFSRTSLQSAFILSGALAQLDHETLTVTVNGIAKDRSEFSWDQSHGSLRFIVPPSASAEIEVKARTGQLPPAFDLGPMSLGEALKVYLDGVEVQNVTLSESILTFEEAPRDGSLIEIATETADSASE